MASLGVSIVATKNEDLYWNHKRWDSWECMKDSARHLRDAAGTVMQAYAYGICPSNMVPDSIDALKFTEEHLKKCRFTDTHLIHQQDKCIEEARTYRTRLEDKPGRLPTSDAYELRDHIMQLLEDATGLCTLGGTL